MRAPGPPRSPTHRPPAPRLRVGNASVSKRAHTGQRLPHPPEHCRSIRRLDGRASPRGAVACRMGTSPPACRRRTQSPCTRRAADVGAREGSRIILALSSGSGESPLATTMASIPAAANAASGYSISALPAISPRFHSTEACCRTTGQHSTQHASSPLTPAPYPAPTRIGSPTMGEPLTVAQARAAVLAAVVGPLGTGRSRSTTRWVGHLVLPLSPPRMFRVRQFGDGQVRGSLGRHRLGLRHPSRSP